MHPPGTIKLFTAVIHSVTWQASAFDTGSHSHPSLIFDAKVGTVNSEYITVRSSSQARFCPKYKR